LQQGYKNKFGGLCRTCIFGYYLIKTQTQNTMTTKEIKTKGLKWASENGCELYVVVKIGEYQWWMISEKTGKHMVTNKGKYGQAYADERVIAHWNGFKQNQSN
jgi:hypothetical protein